MLTSYSTLLKVSDRNIQNLNDQHPDRCQIKQSECILFGQPGSHLFMPFFDTNQMYNLNRIGADRVDLGLFKSTLSAPICYHFTSVNLCNFGSPGLGITAKVIVFEVLNLSLHSKDVLRN